MPEERIYSSPLPTWELWAGAQGSGASSCSSASRSAVPGGIRRGWAYSSISVGFGRGSFLIFVTVFAICRTKGCWNGLGWMGRELKADPHVLAGTPWCEMVIDPSGDQSIDPSWDAQDSEGSL